MTTHYKELRHVKIYQINYIVLFALQTILFSLKIYYAGLSDLVLQAIFFSSMIDFIIWFYLKEREERIQCEIVLDKYIETTAQILDFEKGRKTC